MVGGAGTAATQDAAPFATDRVREGTFTYRMLDDGVPVGVLVMEVSRASGRLLLREHTEVPTLGADAQTLVEVDALTFRPLSLRATGELFGAPIDIDLGWEGDSVAGYTEVARGPDQSRGRVPVALEGVDSYERTTILLVAHALRLDRAPLVFRSFDPHQAREVEITVEPTGEVDVVVPSGTYRAHRVAVRGGSPEWVLYVSTRPPATLVRIEVVGQPWAYELIPDDGLRRIAPPPFARKGECVVYLVRHAETEPDGTRDPHLSERGRARAETLAGMLELAGVDAVYSTPLKRTRQTAAPIAERLGLSLLEYAPDGLEGLADRVCESPGRSLVVGHSNTTPEMVTRLGGDPGGFIRESEYDRLYVVTRREEAAATTLLLRSVPASADGSDR
jgi:phosphohistidine phosphatase SixA